MEVNQDTIPQIPIEFDLEWLPTKVRKLKPVFYKNGDLYFCLYGPDAEVGIYGMGETLRQAAIAWEKELEERLSRLTEGDEVTHHASRYLGPH